MAANATAKFPPPTATLDNSSTFDGISVAGTYTMPSLPAVNLTFGTGAGQIDLVSKLYTGTLAATTLNVDLTALVDDKGNAVNMARVKGVLLYNFAVTSGFILKAGAAATNPWAAIVGTAASDRIVVPNGYTAASGAIVPGFVLICAPDGAALVTSGTSKVLKLDAGANSVPYAYAFFGCDS